MTADPTSHDHPFNTELLHRWHRSTGVEVAGSIHAAAPAHQRAAARMLSQRRIWVHADVFADEQTGVSPDLVTQLAGAGVGPIDVHLLAAGALDALDVVCRPGIARVTFPFEGAPHPASTAARIRASGASPWLAVAPETTLQACAHALSHVDGLLVMLVEPGSQDSSDPALLTKVEQAARSGLPVGVDGGVGETNLDSVLATGATYVVIGRRLFAGRPTTTEEEPNEHSWQHPEHHEGLGPGRTGQNAR